MDGDPNRVVPTTVTGDLGVARALVDRAVHLTLRAIGDEAGLSIAYEALGVCLLLCYRHDEAHRCFQEGLELARASANAHSEATLPSKRGLVALTLLDFTTAWSDFDASYRLHHGRGTPSFAGSALVDRAMAAAGLGRADEAEADLERGRELLGRPGSERSLGLAYALCAVAADGFLARARGEAPHAVHRRVRAAAAPLIDPIPPSAGDLDLRLAELVLEATGAHRRTTE